MSLRQDQVDAGFRLLEGDRRTAEPRGLERMMTELVRARDNIRAFLGQLEGYDAESAHYLVTPETGLHENVTDNAEASLILARATERARTLAQEIVAWLT